MVKSDKVSTNLARLKDKLLDLGKRNQMLYLKPTAKTIIKISHPDWKTIYNDILEGSNLKLKRKIDLLTPSQRDKLSLEIKSKNTTEENIFSNEDINLTKSLIDLDLIRDRIESDFIFSESNDFDLMMKANRIKARGKTLSEDSGVDALFLVLSVVQWRETPDSKEYYKAPLIMIPTVLQMDKNYTYLFNPNEDELVINPALKILFKKNFAIDLPELIETENGYDLEDFIEKTRKIFKNIGFSILNESYLGIFAFSKLAMYKDIDTNFDQLLSNRFVKIMSGGEVKFEENEASLIEINQQLDKLSTAYGNRLVVDADGSQLAAIEMAKSGMSFVIQGPPGTGKSQTITNMIAELIAMNKKVLFVSEKLAALNVVHANLSKVNLGEFCLILHNAKTKKDLVIADLYNAFSAEKRRAINKDETIQQRDQLREELADYVTFIHEKQPKIDLSLYALISKFYAYSEAVPYTFITSAIRYASKDIESHTTILKEYVNLSDVFGHQPEEYPLYGIKKDLSFDSPVMDSNFWDSLTKILTTMMEALIDLGLPKEVINSLEFSDVKKIFQNTTSYFSQHEVSLEDVEETWFLKENHRLLLDKIELIKKSAQLIVEFENENKNLFIKPPINIDVALLDKLIKESQQWFSLVNPFYYLHGIQLNKFLKIKSPISKVGLFATKIKNYQEAVKNYKNYEDQFAVLFNQSWNGLSTDWEKAHEQIKHVDGIISIYHELNKWRLNKKEKQKESSIDLTIFRQIDMSYRKFHENFLAFEPNFKFSTQTFTLSLTNLHEKDLKELKNFFESLTESISNYSKWNVFLTTLDKIKQLQLDSFLKFVQENHATLDIANAYRKSFYHSWAKYLIDKNKLTSNFHKDNHEDKIHRFIQLDQEILLHNRSRVREAVYANKPNGQGENLAPSSEQAILSREFTKKRNKFSVRKLFQAIPNLIKEIKPVIMMSPITVANFLKMGDFKFDVLIFDEASQIFPYDAIGSLARAEQVIIAGDREQLPPTNFFLTGSDTDVLDIDDENEEDFTATDSTEFESILDLANSRLRNISLMWHYRSRNEGLIAFSNKEIYLNKLITFPSINDGIKHDGVEFILVENGIYERGKSKTNRQEADKIIELIIQHIKEHPDRSLGVVTINSNQQELIENLLLKRMQGNSKLEHFISGESHPKEPFFIKNIESVQGDERDTILFGIGYGRDTTGNFKMNFGPINHVGGERRLNVAITRAKMNMKVIASVRGNDFKITEKTPRGVKLLSDYLAYAEKGSYPFSTKALNNEENERNFEEEVARFLEKKGFLIERKVGVSSFKIDIAIRHPDRPKVYILGIECDGDTYVAGKTVRDRDALRQLVLERLGWRIYRVWSTDWFKFPLAAQEKLIETINRILEGKDSNTPTIESLKKKQEMTNLIQEEIKVKESKLSFQEYEVADSDVKKLNGLYGYVYDQENHQGYIKIFNAILEKESPVHISRFYELMKPYYDRNVMTVFIKNAFDYQLKITKSKELIPFMMVDDIFIKSEQKEFPFRTKKGFMRPIKTVYFFELIEGMKTIVNHYKVISKTHLIEQLYLACNYPPYGKKDLDVFANLVNEAVQMKYLVEDNSVIKLGEKSI